ncbi:hypothetical protein KC573_00505, partial [candidate division WWE3 bacterium]|nr:hypothetical protein [candidate division WWE3 bacterium]
MHKKISEFQAKSALFDYLASPELIVEITDINTIDTLPQKYPWLLSTKLVAKPDIGIGKRGKQGLISLKNDWIATRDWIESQWNKTITHSPGQDSRLNRFIVQEYIPHAPNDEWYLSFQTDIENDILLLSPRGGTSVEQSWDSISRLKIDLINGIDISSLEHYINQHYIIHSQDITTLVQFIEKLYTFFVEYAFVELEINPLIVRNRSIHVVDLKAKIDTDAYWQNAKLWNEYDFIGAHKKLFTDVDILEDKIRNLDQASGSSLKCKILNSNGSIWPLTAGGGASIVVLDAIAQRGLIDEVGFYGEYSGNPDNQLMHAYAEAIINFMLSSKSENQKTLLILGATANFTDVRETFAGIISALELHASELQRQN